MTTFTAEQSKAHYRAGKNIVNFLLKYYMQQIDLKHM